MFNAIKNLFSSGPKESSEEILAKGAYIVDVRSPSEFKTGHVKGSVNIPLETISSKINQLKSKPYIVVCCRSGNRSGMAKSILKSGGISNVANGGSWQNVNSKMKK
jgi:phage shock protein E